MFQVWAEASSGQGALFITLFMYLLFIYYIIMVTPVYMSYLPVKYINTGQLGASTATKLPEKQLLKSWQCDNFSKVHSFDGMTFIYLFS